VDIPPPDNWSTKSKKEMALGFAILLAGIGSEPIFFVNIASEPALLLFPLAIIAGGVYYVYLGFLQK
jgi:hypothetical protein